MRVLVVFYHYFSYNIYKPISQVNCSLSTNNLCVDNGYNII